MFKSARIKLTIWYTLLILLISGALSGLFYSRTVSVLEVEYQRIQTRMELEWQGFIPPPPGRTRKAFSLEDLEEAKLEIFWQLVKINGLIIVAFSAAGYWLSGITLKPIAQTMDEQSRFIGDAAHELKTPITGLKTSLEVNLMDETLNKETKKILRENLADVTSLQSLSENLLALARRSDQPVPLKSVPICPIVDQAIRHVKPLANKKKIEILTIGDYENLRVRADESLLMDLLLIFLDNAIKYSPTKTTITVCVIEDKKYILLSVTDHGAGISKDDLPHIFDRFYRADKARTKKDTNGYGLGLSVAKKITEQINATLMVRSEIGKGFGVYRQIAARIEKNLI